MAVRRALLEVDLQVDFFDGGKLPVCKAEKIIPTINRLQTLPWKLVVRTQDSHPANHISFSSSHVGKSDVLGNRIVAEKTHTVDFENFSGSIFATHCQQGTPGEGFVPSLKPVPCIVIRKGTKQDVEAFSAFCDENGEVSKEAYEILDDHKIDSTYVSGVAGELCVKRIVQDLAKRKDGDDKPPFKVYVITDTIRFVDPQKKQETFDSLESEYHVSLVSSADVVRTFEMDAIWTPSLQCALMDAIIDTGCDIGKICHILSVSDLLVQEKIEQIIRDMPQEFDAILPHIEIKSFAQLRYCAKEVYAAKQKDVEIAKRVAEAPKEIFNSASKVLSSFQSEFQSGLSTLATATTTKLTSQPTINMAALRSELAETPFKASSTTATESKKRKLDDGNTMSPIHMPNLPSTEETVAAKDISSVHGVGTGATRNLLYQKNIRTVGAIASMTNDSAEALKPSIRTIFALRQSAQAMITKAKNEDTRVGDSKDPNAN